MKKKTEAKPRTHSNGRAQKIHQNGLQKSKDVLVSKCTQKLVGGGVGGGLCFPATAALISLVTLALRVYYVTDRANWVTVHPDEVFQSMEVAHTELYGYGFRSYEFASSFEDNSTTTRYRQMELDAGLSAMRSPIFPYYYVIVGQLTSLVRLDANPYLMFRVSHVLVTSLLPASVYFYCTSMFHSTNVATLSSLLIASSVHLNVLGTHCFLQSFLSPLIFLTLAMVASLSEGSEKESLPNRTSCTVDYSEQDNNNVTIDKNNNITPDESNFKQGEFDVVPFSTKCASSTAFKSIFTGFLIGMSCYIRPDVILTHFVNLCLLLSISWSHCRRIMSQSLLIVVGLTISFVLGVLIDTCFYGGFTVTPWNWFVVNIIQNISTSVFGKMDLWFYFRTFYSLDTAVCGVCAFFLIVYVTITVTSILRQSSKRGERQNMHDEISSYIARFSLCCVCLLVIYSCHGHKEIRFIHDTIVYVLILSALITYQLFSLVDIDYIRTNSRRISVGIVLVIFWAFQWRKFYNHSSTTQWTYQHTPDIHHTNVCLEFISQQPDVSGVFLEDNVFTTGGITILHKDVPLFSRVMNGFFDFDTDSRINKTSSQSTFTAFFSKNGKNVSVNAFTCVSNYVSLGNGAGILRAVLEKQEYNYFVLTKDQPFKKMGFQQVFEAGNRKVLKRVGDSDSERQIRHVLDRLTLGTDPKALIHEGDVLYHMRLYQKASDRYQHALKLSSGNTETGGAYLPLYECLERLGRHTDGVEVMGQCVERHGEETCWTPRRMTRLYG